MEKALLSKFPFKPASNNLVGMAKKCDNSIKVFAHVEKVDRDKIALSAYAAKDLLNGTREPFLRAFFHKNPNEVIKQLRTDGGKWKWVDKKLENIEDFYENSNRFSMDSIKSLKLFKSFFHYAFDTSIPTRIYSFENEIYNVRRKERHEIEHSFIEQTMKEEFSEKLPKRLHNWAMKNAFTPYLFYTKNKSSYHCKCSFCKKETTVSAKVLKLRHKRITVCPSCHHEVVACSEGKIKYPQWEYRNVAYLIENGDKSFKIRYITYSRGIHPSTFENPNFRYFEGLRTIHKGSHIERYEYYTRYNYFTDWWESPEIGERISYSTLVPKSGLELYGTCLLYPTKLTGCLKYSGIDYINADNLSIQEPFDLEAMIAKYYDNPEGVEKILKSGYKNLITTLDKRSYHSAFDFHAKTLYDITKLSKVSYRYARDNNLSNYEVKLIRLLDSLKQKYALEDIRLWSSIGDDLLYRKWEEFSMLMEIVSFKAFVNFLRRAVDENHDQNGNSKTFSPGGYLYKLQSVYLDYFDYLSAIEELKYVKTDKYYLLPKNFKENHDRVSEELKAVKDKISAEKKRREAQIVAKKLEEANKILKFNEGNDADDFKSKDYIIRIPKSADEIREEGVQMHHCVGSYVSKVARGETCIFFVRKLEDPDKSFCTLEWNNGIVQCRAEHNNRPSDDVWTFVRAFDLSLKQNGITTAKLTGLADSLKENIAI